MQDFRINTFLSACETLNYTKTAELLCITQPAVSQHIRFLEEAYGAKLFIYRNRRLILTDAGRLLRDASRNAISDDNVLLDKMRALTGQRENLALGFTMTVGGWMTSASLAQFIKRHDDLKISIYIDDTQSLLQALDDGSIDCAVIEGYFEKQRYGHRLFAYEEFVGVCPPGMFDDTHRYSLEELLNNHLITREKGSGTRDVLEHALAAENLSIQDFERVTQINDIPMIKDLVEQGCGISFLYKAAVEDELNSGRLDRIRLDCDTLGHDITAVWRSGSSFAAFYENVLGELKTDSNPS